MMMRKLMVVATFFAVAMSSASASGEAARQETFDAVWKTTEQNFFDPTMKGLDWNDVRNHFEAPAKKAKDKVAFTEVVNQMLGLLEMSHTRYLPPDDPLLPIYLDVFRGNPDLKSLIEAKFGNGQPVLDGIGLFTKEIDNRHFAQIVLEDGPAAKAGIRRGDEIVTINGEDFTSDAAFAGTAGKSLEMGIRRAEDAPIETITVISLTKPALEWLDTASEMSVELLTRNGKKVLYMRFYSFAGDVVERVLATAPLADADLVVIDARAIVGGGGANLLEKLDPRFGALCFQMRSGGECQNGSFRGKSVLITNAMTRSGAEIMAYGFARQGFGKIVGETTAGAVSGGRLYPMPDGGALYVAVASLEVDGKTLEGVGVSPDIVVADELRYADGRDAQREKAIAVATGL